MVNEYLARSTNFRATTDFDEGIAHSDVYESPAPPLLLQRQSQASATHLLLSCPAHISSVVQIPHLCGHTFHWRRKALRPQHAWQCMLSLQASFPHLVSSLQPFCTAHVNP
jgi:hypothetical protein